MCVCMHIWGRKCPLCIWQLWECTIQFSIPESSCCRQCSWLSASAPLGCKAAHRRPWSSPWSAPRQSLCRMGESPLPMQDVWMGNLCSGAPCWLAKTSSELHQTLKLFFSNPLSFLLSSARCQTASQSEGSPNSCSLCPLFFTDTSPNESPTCLISVSASQRLRLIHNTRTF